MTFLNDKIRWGILGTGTIARKFASDLPRSRTGRLVAVASRSAATAQAFATRFPGIRTFDSYEALLSAADVDAVYVATPHSEHLPWVLRAASRGKHLLCEKPLGLNRGEAVAMVAAARERRVFLMEALMYRCHPQTMILRELVQSRAVGELRVIEASFATAFPFDPHHRVYDRRLGGGAILDLGVYPMSFARLMAGAAFSQPFAEPVRFTGAGRLNEVTGVDEYAAATALFPGGIVAQLACGVCVSTAIQARLFGTAGWIDVPVPFFPGIGGRPEKIVIHRSDATGPRELPVDGGIPLYGLEADVVGDALAVGLRESPFLTHADSLGTLALLDAWRADVGVAYDADRIYPSRTDSPAHP